MWHKVLLTCNHLAHTVWHCMLMASCTVKKDQWVVVKTQATAEWFQQNRTGNNWCSVWLWMVDTMFTNFAILSMNEIVVVTRMGEDSLWIQKNSWSLVVHLSEHYKFGLATFLNCLDIFVVAQAGAIYKSLSHDRQQCPAHDAVRRKCTKRGYYQIHCKSQGSALRQSPCKS